MFKVVSFNINGIRARPHQLEALKARQDPDVIGLQESKVHDEAFPLDITLGLGYRAHFHGQKSHYGVALLSKAEPLEVVKGLPGDRSDAQRRAITGRFALSKGEEVTVINAYFPQGEARAHPVKFPAKRQFYADLAGYVRERFTPDQNLIILGWWNVTPTHPKSPLSRTSSLTTTTEGWGIRPKKAHKKGNGSTCLTRLSPWRN